MFYTGVSGNGKGFTLTDVCVPQPLTLLEDDITYVRGRGECLMQGAF